MKKQSKIATRVYKYLQTQAKPLRAEDMVQNQIVTDERQARYACNLLISSGLVVRIPDLNDLRSFYYKAVVKA